MKALATRLQQVHLQTGDCPVTPVAFHPETRPLYKEEHERVQHRLLQLCPSYIWPHGSHELACPRPILITPQHKNQLSQLHDALVLAIIDIIERWWTDVDAGFPARMPVGREEEDLLRWIDKNHLPYWRQIGSWRPDFLVEEPPDGGEVENFRITEINARFSFNGFMHQAYGQTALNCLSADKNGAIDETDPTVILNGLVAMLRFGLPVHLLKGREKGIDIHMFIDYLDRHLGVKPRLITPSDLRLLPGPQDLGISRLYCIAKQIEPSAAQITIGGETLEEVHQVGLELHQDELFSLSPEILRAISVRCFNDLRTILLVHDKRMLGIVKGEIPNLVHRRILSPVQGQALDNGIADTILPRSAELDDLICRSARDGHAILRKEYLLKPIRGGKGAGIVFGDQLDPSQWAKALERLRDRDHHSTSCQGLQLPAAGAYVVQRLIHPVSYEVVLGHEEERARYPLVGTYHAVHGRFLGFGIWRCSEQRICAISQGGSWMCTVMQASV